MERSEARKARSEARREKNEEKLSKLEEARQEEERKVQEVRGLARMAAHNPRYHHHHLFPSPGVIPLPRLSSRQVKMLGHLHRR